jgi:hypothetical protein
LHGLHILEHAKKVGHFGFAGRNLALSLLTVSQTRIFSGCLPANVFFFISVFSSLHLLEANVLDE